MKKNKNIEKNIKTCQKSKNKKEEIIKNNIYTENITDEQKQKIKDYRKECYKR